MSVTTNERNTGCNKRVTVFGGGVPINGDSVTFSLSPPLTGVTAYRLRDVIIDAANVVFTPGDFVWALYSGSLSGSTKVNYYPGGSSVGGVFEWFDSRDALQINGHYTPHEYIPFVTSRDIAYFDLSVKTAGNTPVTAPGASVLGVVIEFVHDYNW